MSWDTTPWFVGGGAVHSPEVARTLAYAAFGGKQGIITPGDLKVQALAVPGSQVRVVSGAASLLAKASGGDQQAYVARNPTEDLVDIAPTGSGAGRSDLIIVRIEDPFMAGEAWSTPANPATAQYVYTRVIPNVSPTQTTMPSGYTGLVLARVDIPASTGTILDSHIKDLRALVNPRTSRVFASANAPTGPNDLSGAVNAQWPPATSATITVPEWATSAVIRADLMGARVTVGATSGNLYARLGSLQSPGTAYNEQAVNDTRRNWLMAGKVSIPSSMRGTAQGLQTFGIRAGGTGALRSDNGVQIIWDVTFTEEAA